MRCGCGSKLSTPDCWVVYNENFSSFAHRDINAGPFPKKKTSAAFATPFQGFAMSLQHFVNVALAVPQQIEPFGALDETNNRHSIDSNCREKLRWFLLGNRVEQVSAFGASFADDLFKKLLKSLGKVVRWLTMKFLKHLKLYSHSVFWCFLQVTVLGEFFLIALRYITNFCITVVGGGLDEKGRDRSQWLKMLIQGLIVLRLSCKSWKLAISRSRKLMELLQSGK